MKAQIDLLQRDETADQQAGTDEQHERNCQLTDGKRRTHAAAAAAVSPRASAFLQAPTRVASGRVQSGNEAEHEAREYRCAGGVRQYLAVNGNVRQPGQFSRRERLKQIRAERGEHQPRRSAEEPQHDALGQ